MWWGVFLPVFGAWVPLVAGIKAAKREWIIWGAILAAVAIVTLALPWDDDDGLTDVLIFAVWAAQAVMTLMLRKPYRLRMGVRGKYEIQTAEAEHIEEERRAVIELARRDAERALALGVGRPDVPGSRHGHVIDVNHAPAGVIASLPGVSNETAAEIVHLRGELNGFDSVDDLGSLLDLHPRVVAAMRLRAVAL